MYLPPTLTPFRLTEHCEGGKGLSRRATSHFGFDADGVVLVGGRSGTGRTACGTVTDREIGVTETGREIAGEAIMGDAEMALAAITAMRIMAFLLMPPRIRSGADKTLIAR
jgi:hypothetical protein